MKGFDGYVTPETGEQLQWELAQLREWAGNSLASTWRYVNQVDRDEYELRDRVIELERRLKRAERVASSRRRIP